MFQFVEYSSLYIVYKVFLYIGSCQVLENLRFFRKVSHFLILFFGWALQRGVRALTRAQMYILFDPKQNEFVCIVGVKNGTRIVSAWY